MCTIVYVNYVVCRFRGGDIHKGSGKILVDEKKKKKKPHREVFINYVIFIYTSTYIPLRIACTEI